MFLKKLKQIALFFFAIAHLDKFYSFLATGESTKDYKPALVFWSIIFLLACILEEHDHISN